MQQNPGCVKYTFQFLSHFPPSTKPPPLRYERGDKLAHPSMLIQEECFL